MTRWSLPSLFTEDIDKEALSLMQAIERHPDPQAVRPQSSALRRHRSLLLFVTALHPSPRDAHLWHGLSTVRPLLVAAKDDGGAFKSL